MTPARPRRRAHTIVEQLMTSALRYAVRRLARTPSFTLSALAEGVVLAAAGGALGARAGDVLRLVLARGMRPVLAGAALGLVAAWLGSQVVARLLYGVATTDALTFAAVPLVLVVALLAALAPARRALRIPPTSALRAE